MDYLIPANTKKGQLILGIFRPMDLIIFGTGVLITVIFMALLPLSSTLVTIIIMLPALVTGFLIIPVPYYHNMLNVIAELIGFFTNQRNYKWKGWCVAREKEFKSIQK